MGAKTATRFTGMALALGGLVGVVLPFIRPGGLVVEALGARVEAPRACAGAG